MKIKIEDIMFMEHSNSDIPYIPLRDFNNVEHIKIINDLELNIDDFYKVSGKLHPYCYFKGTVYVEIYEISESFFKNFMIKERIEQTETMHKKCIESNDYKTLFIYIDKPFRFQMYEDLFEYIPDNQKYDIFKTIYMSSEYGFNKLSVDFLIDVFKYKNSNEKRFKKDIIMIYRGEGTKSTPFTNAYSWTTELKVANKFANRFSGCGKVYRGYVRQEDILDYYTNRGEYEIIVFPKNVFNVELIK